MPSKIRVHALSTRRTMPKPSAGPAIPPHLLYESAVAQTRRENYGVDSSK